ncbi:MAG: flagellar basal body rod protein FlgC [Gammaproteobacteria bacterium]|nr:flagellar basal body rod protein FlgC [Gammaproteobacteria bacterium]
MGLFTNFDISGSAISAQSIRLNTTASNMANSETIASSREEAYRARQPIFQAMMNRQSEAWTVGVRMLGVVESQDDVMQRYDPGHAMANEEGYIFASNVNPVEEMANMISASRAYQNNVEVLNTSRDLLMRALSLGN